MRIRLAVAVLLVVAVAWALGPAGAQQGKIEVHWLGQAATKITSVTGKVSRRSTRTSTRSARSICSS